MFLLGVEPAAQRATHHGHVLYPPHHRGAEAGARFLASLSLCLQWVTVGVCDRMKKKKNAKVKKNDSE